MKKRFSGCSCRPRDTWGREGPGAGRGRATAWKREAGIILDALPLMLADTALKGAKNVVAGANKENDHLKNVSPLRDFHPTMG